LSICTSNRVRWLFGTDASGTHPELHKLPAVNVTTAPEPVTAVPPTFAVTVTCSAFVSVNVTVQTPFVPVVQFVDDVPLTLPDPFTPKSTRTPDKATLFAFFAVAVTVTDDPTVVDVVDNAIVDFDAFAVPTKVTDTGDDDPVPLPPDCGVNTTAVPPSVTVAENEPTVVAVYFTEPTPLAFVFVVVAVTPVPDDATVAPETGLPYLSNAYTVASSTPPPASWLFVVTTTRVR
jgi:hypothetical protein